MNRRTIMATLPGLILAGCTGTPRTINQIAVDTQAVVSGLSAVMPQIAALAGVPATTIARITADVEQAKAAATALASLSVGGVAPTTTTQLLVQAVNDVVGLLTVPPLSQLIPPSIEAVLTAAQSLLPSIEAAAGLSGSTAAPSMSPDAARLILKAAATH